MEERCFEHYYEDAWETEVVRCEGCDWEGKLEDAESEIFDTYLACECPKCEKTLATVLFPTAEEVRAHYSKVAAERPLTELEKTELYLLNKGERKKTMMLCSPEQLPDIDNDVKDIVLSWDYKKVGSDLDTDHWTVIRHGSAVICTEPAIWTGIDRFEQVVPILVQRYGDRLVDVLPTEGSLLWLGGDALNYEERVEGVSRLFKRKKVSRKMRVRSQ